MDRFIFLTVDGLSHGAIYAAFALALVLIWRGTRVVNFAQGAMAVAAAYIAFSVTSATGSYWLGAIAAVGAGLVLGVLVERGAMKWVGHTNPLTAIVVALGSALVIEAVLGMVYGVNNRPFPVPFSRTKFTIRGHPLFSPYDLFVFGVVAAVLDRDRVAVHAYPHRFENAGGGVRAGDGAAARGQHRPGPDPGLGPGQCRRCDGQPADPAHRISQSDGDGPGLRVGVHGGGDRRPGQSGRRRRRRSRAGSGALLRQRLPRQRRHLDRGAGACSSWCCWSAPTACSARPRFGGCDMRTLWQSTLLRHLVIAMVAVLAIMFAHRLRRDVLRLPARDHRGLSRARSPD